MSKAFVPTRESLAKFAPGAPAAWLDAFATLSRDLCPFYGMTLRRWRHFAAQWHAETNGLALHPLRENMTFTTQKRILEVYRYRLKLCIEKVDSGKVAEPKIARGKSVAALAKACVREPRLLADIVYGGREGTPWMEGSRYLGRGPFQITHKDNYARIAQEIARQPGGQSCPDLVLSPELLEEPELGVRAAFADWHLKSLSKWADADDLASVSDILNTGNNRDSVKPHGMANRKRAYARAIGVWSDYGDKAIVPVTPDAVLPTTKSTKTVIVPEIGVARPGDRDSDTVRVLQARLSALGYRVGSKSEGGAFDGHYGLLTERAVVAFQREHGLEVDAVVGPKTWAALQASAPAELPARADLTGTDLVNRGSETVWYARALKWGGRIAGGFGFGTAADAVSGVGAVDGALTQLETVRTTAARTTELAGFFLTPKGLVILVLVGVAFAIWWAGSRIETRRVEAARNAQDLTT